MSETVRVLLIALWAWNGVLAASCVVLWFCSRRYDRLIAAERARIAELEHRVAASSAGETPE